MVRKRKNSEETVPAAPRLTRLRRNLEEEGDAESTMNETSNKSARTPKTPSTGRQNTRKKNLTARDDSTMSTRSQRVRVLKSSSDSDAENRGDESKGVESYPTRLRSRKDAGNSTIVHDLINSTAENLTEPKRQPQKRKRVLTAADNTLTESQSQGKSTRSQAKTVSTKINEIPDPKESEIQNSPSELKNKKSATLRRIIETPRKVSPRKQSTPLVDFASETITPESSPMLVNLTPHRSTKTPKKSPMNIGSPKTHSQSPLRLSKTPRKLTINVESPATSDKSSLSNQSPKGGNNNFQTSNIRDPFVVLTDFKKDESPRVDKSTEFQSENDSPPSFVSTAKLRPRKLPAKIQSGVDSSTKQNERNSPVSPKRKLSPVKKPTALGSKIRKSPVKTPVSNRKIISLRIQTPKRTPPNVGQNNPANPESPKRPKSNTKKRSPVTSSGTPLRPINEHKESSDVKNINSPSSAAPKKIQLLMQLKNTTPETTPKGRIRRSLHLTPDFIKFSSGSTSSPIITPKRTAKISNSPVNFAGLEGSKMIKDLSLELIDASSLMNMSDDVFSNSIKPSDGTYELSKSKEEEEEDKETSKKLDESEVKDATYELAEPKTPSLKKKSRKRSLSNVEPDKCTPEAKKICRVRFASPTKEKTPNSSRKSLPTVNTPAKQRIEGRLSRTALVPDSSRRRSRSLTKIDEKPGAQRGNMKRRSISASDLTNKTPKLNRSTQDSVNRLSKPRQSISSEAKLEIKLPVPRKAPNFAQIHQKKFAEMESLVDAKKRVAKRHEELNTLPSTRSFQFAATSTIVSEPAAKESSKQPAPTDPKNGAFNRFGFKLRKAEALKVITKNPVAVSRSQKNHQQNNRTILKGVRTNRRFELQMKMRNIKD